MKFNELGHYDSSLLLQRPSFWDEEIVGLTSVDDPRDHHLAFIKNRGYLDSFFQKMTKFSDRQKMGVVIEHDLWKSIAGKTFEKVGLVATVKDVPLSLTKLSKPFYEQAMKNHQDLIDGRQMEGVNIHPTAWIAQGVFIGEDVKIAENVKIHPQVVILSGCEIEAETEIFPHVTLYHHVKIGKSCRIHAGSVIGSDGFGYHFDNGIHHKIWHMGGVEIKDFVEIGANTTIDGGTFAKTLIGEGCKIDNGVQVSHNCQLGKGVVLCGHSALSGSVIVGNYSIFGGKAGAREDCTIGENCRIAAASVVSSDWPSGSTIGGAPARPLNEWLKGVAYVRRESLKKNKNGDS